MSASADVRDQLVRPNKRAYEDNEAELVRIAKQRKELVELAEAHEAKSKELAYGVLYEDVRLIRNAHFGSGSDIERLVRMAQAVYTFLTSKYQPEEFIQVKCELEFEDKIAGTVRVLVHYRHELTLCTRLIDAKGVVTRCFDPVGNVFDADPKEWLPFFLST